MRTIPYILLMALMFTSCHSSRKAGSASTYATTGAAMNAYISTYADLAMSEMRRTGVPASITLAQAIIESDYGRSRLAREANNHFGIKCHNGWKGGKIYHDDDRRNECFRRYREPIESYKDHSDFLVQGSRYRFLFELDIDDYRGWARGLKKAGYATNPRYAGMLIDMIEKNDLHVYDELVISGRQMEKQKIYAGAGPDTELSERSEQATSNAGFTTDNFVVSRHSRVEERNRIEYIIVEEGDTYESLAREFELLRWEIFRYNDLEDNAVLRPGQLLYLQPKRKKAGVGNDFHIVKEGETMYEISQLYGIRLKSLYEKNRMEPGYEPPAGTELWLRKLKPEGL